MEIGLVATVLVNGCILAKPQSRNFGALGTRCEIWLEGELHGDEVEGWPDRLAIERSLCQRKRGWLDWTTRQRWGDCLEGYVVKQDGAQPTVAGSPARRTRLIFSTAGSPVQSKERLRADEVTVIRQIQGRFAGLLGLANHHLRPATQVKFGWLRGQEG